MLVALIVAAALPASPAGLESPRPLGGDGSLDTALQNRLQRIETAFRAGDAGSLRRSCAASGKVRVELGDMADGQGSYGPGQLQVIFDQIFGQARTTDFAFAKEDVRSSPSGTAFARVRWTRRGHPRGAEIVDSLTFTLREESGDWRILEIRSSR